ncbi:MAG: hypothetical protein K6F85_04610 [Bacteroidales bacterium]|nr:hypothetical protein [Bacteroidales bacterium]
MSENTFLTRNYEPWKIKVQKQLAAKAIALHENDTDRKGEKWYIAEPAIPLFYECHSKDELRHFCIAPSSEFFRRLILDEDLARRVVRDFPGLFGTKRPEDVLCALWQQDPNYPNISYERFCSIAEHDQYAWIVEYDDNGVVGDKYLRLDLFRHIDYKDGKYIFQGGLLHVLNHFSFHDTPLSSDFCRDDVPNIQYILQTIIEAFFMLPLEKDTSRGKTQYTTRISHKNRNPIAVFYYNEKAGVYFVDSLHIKK